MHTTNDQTTHHPTHGLSCPSSPQVTTDEYEAGENTGADSRVITRPPVPLLHPVEQDQVGPASD